MTWSFEDAEKVRPRQPALSLGKQQTDIGGQPGQWLLRAKWAAGGGQRLQLSEERSAQGLGLEMSRRDRKYVNCLKDGSPPAESTSKTIMQVRALNIRIVINSPPLEPHSCKGGPTISPITMVPTSDLWL